MRNEFAIAAELQTQGHKMVLCASTILACGAAMESLEDKAQQTYMAEAQTAITAMVGKQNSSNMVQTAKLALKVINSGQWVGYHNYTSVQDAGLAMVNFLNSAFGVKNRTQLKRYLETGSPDKAEPTPEQVGKDATDAALKKEAAQQEARDAAAETITSFDAFGFMQATPETAPETAPETVAEPVKTFDFAAMVAELTDENLADLRKAITAEIAERKRSVADVAAA